MDKVRSENSSTGRERKSRVPDARSTHSKYASKIYANDNLFSAKSSGDHVRTTHFARNNPVIAHLYYEFVLIKAIMFIQHIGLI